MNLTFLRSQAVISLVDGWKKPQHLEDAAKMLHNDPAWLARADAAFALFSTRHDERMRARALHEFSQVCSEPF
jgi:aryl-alcohol dehydrogenase-like predicted oxidoreductase